MRPVHPVDIVRPRSRPRFLPFVLLVATLCVSANAGTGIYEKAIVQPAIQLRAYPFDLSQVRLLDGPFKEAMELDRRYLLDLDPDRMLSVIFKNSGQEPRRNEAYGGWCSGTLAGHYLTAISKMHASTGDEELRRRAHYMVDELARVQEANGGQYIGVRNPKEKLEEKLFAAEELDAWHGGVNDLANFLYPPHKIMAGLIDAYVHTDYPKALTVAAKYADWFAVRYARMDDEKFQTMLKMENGGIMEAMAWLYALTGNPDYMELAKRFDHKRDMDAMAERRDEFKGLHANTTIPKVIGASVAREFTGLERYYNICDFFWDRAVHTRSFITGGVDYHEYFRGPGEEAAFLDWDSNESCCVYNMLKLTRHLFSWRPDAAYMDYYERALYNHILASQDSDAIGHYAYFSALKPGDFKVYSTPYDSMWCCVKTGIEKHSKYGNSIYYHKDDTLWVNLFIASVLDWKEKGLVVRQETDFNDFSVVRRRIKADNPQPLSLKLRIPYWASEKSHVYVNGEKQDVEAKPQSYLTLTRTWKDRDVIQIQFGGRVRLYEARDDKSVVGFMVGPFVLAGMWGDEFLPESDVCGQAHHQCYEKENSQPAPVLLADAGDPSIWVKKLDKHPLRYRTVNTHNGKEVIFAPVYQAHHQRYSVYWKLADAALLNAPPQPERAQWRVEPYAVDAFNIAMVAAPPRGASLRRAQRIELGRIPTHVPAKPRRRRDDHL